MVSASHDDYKLHNSITSGFSATMLSSYMNYVKLDTSGATVDNAYQLGSLTCDAADPCVRMHNGATVYLYSLSFGGTATTNAVAFAVDPDGVYAGTTDGPGKSVVFMLYTNGRLMTAGTRDANTYHSTGGPYGPCSYCDPPWFSWN